MKYRIIVDQLYNGKKLYYPQYKKYFKWKYWYEMDAYDFWNEYAVLFSDEALARAFIEKKIGNKIKNTTYINYGKIY
nr:MAG TPA: hypothetical protein [Caudoviricetes sp.]